MKNDFQATKELFDRLNVKYSEYSFNEMPTTIHEDVAGAFVTLDVFGTHFVFNEYQIFLGIWDDDCEEWKGRTDVRWHLAPTIDSPQDDTVHDFPTRADAVRWLLQQGDYDSVELALHDTGYSLLSPKEWEQLHLQRKG